MFNASLEFKMSGLFNITVNGSLHSTNLPYALACEIAEMLHRDFAPLSVVIVAA